VAGYVGKFLRRSNRGPDTEVYFGPYLVPDIRDSRAVSIVGD
jgi:hypothetical protein